MPEGGNNYVSGDLTAQTSQRIQDAVDVSFLSQQVNLKLDSQLIPFKS